MEHENLIGPDIDDPKDDVASSKGRRRKKNKNDTTYIDIEDGTAEGRRQDKNNVGTGIDAVDGEAAAHNSNSTIVNMDHSSTSDAPPGMRRSVSFPGHPGTGVVPDLGWIDVNTYQQKKTLAQGMMDLALLSANANQLRQVVEARDIHPYFYPSVTLVSLSIFFQIAVGFGLILNSRYDVNNRSEGHKADRINNFTVICVYLVTIVNVFITTFGMTAPAELTFCWNNT